MAVRGSSFHRIAFNSRAVRTKFSLSYPVSTPTIVHCKPPLLFSWSINRAASPLGIAIVVSNHRGGDRPVGVPLAQGKDNSALTPALLFGYNPASGSVVDSCVGSYGSSHGSSFGRLPQSSSFEESWLCKSRLGSRAVSGMLTLPKRFACMLTLRRTVLSHLRSADGCGSWKSSRGSTTASSMPSPTNQQDSRCDRSAPPGTVRSHQIEHRNRNDRRMCSDAIDALADLHRGNPNIPLKPTPGLTACEPLAADNLKCTPSPALNM